MKYKSRIIEKAVKEISYLPGIGERSAIRLILHLLKSQNNRIDTLSNSIKDLENIIYCKECNNISDTELCNICSNKFREKSLICVVEDIRDLIAIENTNQYNALYHILGGRISPMEGITAEHLKIDSLENRIKKGDIKEMFLALSSTMEGDTTSFYLYKKFSIYPIKITSIARGISNGNEIEYIDENTLTNSIKNRVLYKDSY